MECFRQCCTCKADSETCSAVQVKISDMQVKSTPRELLAGDPMCTPAASAISEALVILIRRLLSLGAWAPHVSAKMCATLDMATAWHAAKTMSMSQDSQGGGRKSEEQSMDSSGESGVGLVVL